MPTTPRAALVPVALFALLAGCGPEPRVAGCELDGDCGDGVCSNGQCQQCRDDGGCGDAQRCVAARCEAAPEAEAEEVAAVDSLPEPAATDEASAPVSLEDLCRTSEPPAEALRLERVSFEFNRAELTMEAQDTLQAHADCLRRAPEVTVVIEGHCDERGTQEFNLALGQDRAQSVVTYLTALGVEGDRLRAISKGKNQPLCGAADEACFARNRRVELIGR